MSFSENLAQSWRSGKRFQVCVFLLQSVCEWGGGGGGVPGFSRAHLQHPPPSFFNLPRRSICYAAVYSHHVLLMSGVECCISRS